VEWQTQQTQNLPTFTRREGSSPSSPTIDYKGLNHSGQKSGAFRANLSWNQQMLSVYRGHKLNCKAGYAKDFRSNELDEPKKGFKKCSCPIVASGTLSGVSRRQTTGAWEFDDAKAIAAAWDAAGSWDSAGAPTVTKPAAQKRAESKLP
jgi:hypothetical protein